jgi:cell division protein FtsB
MATAVAHAARPRREARRRPRSRKAVAQRRVAGGAVWIVIMAVLLAGVVALNVAVLRLNLQSDQLGREQAQLRADNSELASELAARAASARTNSRAKRELGLTDPNMTTYLQLNKR